MSINIKTHGYDISRNTSPNRSAIKYIVLHYTATSGATSANEIAYFATNPAATNASADFFVDDSEIRQYNTQLDRRYSWAVGVDYSGGTAPFWGKCTNANSVSIEMSCTLSGGIWHIGAGTYNNALELTRYLMSKYNVPASNVIRHYDVCAKNCPGAYGWLASTGSDATWKKFKSALGGTSTAATQSAAPSNTSKTLYRVQCGAFAIKSNAEGLCGSLKNKGFKDTFVVKVGSGISDIMYRVQCGAFADKNNAEAMKKKLQAIGVKDAFITTSDSGATAKKTNTEIAKEVIAGKWGVGADRKTRLTNAGYDYNAVQAEVNRLMS